MKKMLIPLLVTGATLVIGCQQQSTDTGASSPVASSSPETPLINKADAAAVVNGQFISKADLDKLVREIGERAHGQTFPKEKILEELIQREILLQDALKKQLDKSPEYLEQLQDVKKGILYQLALQNFLKNNPVTDADVKAEYDSKVVAESGVEYKARHILVKTEAEAKKIIAELGKKGSDFAKLANKNSIDAKESQNGGDLGWFSPGQMVQPFSEAVAKLENGKYSKEPVKTQFGWHVILREESRAQTPPPLDAVKDQLMPYLQRKKVQDMVESLRKQANVEILIPLDDGKPKQDAAPAPTAEGAKAEPTPAEEKPAEPAPAAASEPPAEAAAAAKEAPAAAEPEKK